jgi:serine/threonine-protein kinase
MLSAHVTEAPRPVAEARAAVPPGLEAMVMRCLEKKPADRWQRADEMLAVLETFATPSSGITPTGTMPVPAVPRGRSAWRKAAAAIGVGALALALWLGIGRLGFAGGGSSAVDPGLFAVVPFRVSGADPSLAYLREGMVDLLTVKLSGTGRAVEPRTVLDAWRRAGGGEADPPLDDIVRLAADLGAGRALLGSAVGSAGQLTLSASLYDAPRGRELATASVAGRSEELPDLIDRLTAQIVSLEAGEAQERLATLTTTSLPALRAYLDGMARYRRGLYRDAAESLALAVSQDSTFAVAALYMGEANAMVLGGVPGAGGSAAIVRAHRNRLGPRDHAYSLALYPDVADGRTSVERWEAAIPQLRDRPEAWYYLGDVLFHSGAMWGTENFLARSKEAFSRAVALDSTYFTPLHHLVWIALIEGDTAFARGVMTRYLETEETGTVASEFRLGLARLDRDSAALRGLDAAWGSLSDDELQGLAVVGAFQFLGSDIARARRAAETLGLRATTPAARFAALDRQYYIAMNTGRPSEADAILDRIGSLPGQAALSERRRIHGAVYWDGDPQAAERAERRIRDAGAQNAADVYALSTWELSQGRTAGVLQTVARLRGSGLAADSLRAGILEAWRAHLERDADAPALARALDARLRRGGATNEVRSHGNLSLARVFEAQGDLPRALAASRRVFWNIDGDRYSSTFLRAEGRLAAAAGELEAAVRAYEGYLSMRLDHEAALQPELDRIRAEVAELRSRLAGR